jgi:hypothetical protein
MSTAELAGRLSCLTLTRLKGLALAERPDAIGPPRGGPRSRLGGMGPEFVDTFARLTEKSQLQLYPFNS